MALQLLMNMRIPVNARLERAQRDRLLGEAFARTKDFESADERLSSALKTAVRLEDEDIISRVGYTVVRRHLYDENAERARAALGLARRGHSRISRIHALCAEAMILAYEERFSEQAERLIELLHLFDPSQRDLTHIRTWATYVLAGWARELYIPAAIPEIERQINGFAWPKDWAHYQFHTLKELAWTKALQGDYFNAFRHLKRASETADRIVSKLVVACDRSYLASCFGERRWSRAELAEAEQVASEVNWAATVADERFALLDLAELFCDTDPTRSSMYLARYRDLGPIRLVLYNQRDARTRAFEQHSTGVVELALGNRKRGLAELRDARAAFERFGYDFRAARCLVTEYRATEDRDLVPKIEEKLRHYQQSWLSSEFRNAIEQPEPRFRRRSSESFVNTL